MNSIKELGLHFIVGLGAPSLSAEESKLLKQLSPAGIILFANNISNDQDWIETLGQLLVDVRAAINRSKIIISIDHEGGNVHRLKAPVSCFPPASCWDTLSGAVGSAMGKELAALGINLNFAPVLDIHSEPSNPVIGARAFASSTNKVSSHAKSFLLAMEAEGVMGCGKHFPGHGDTKEDSHLELPVLDLKEEMLQEREIQPFIELIDAGLKMIMTAHVLYPQLDQEFPATLSKKIIKGLLRTKLGFEGIVISDALEMKALKQELVAENALLAIEAGVDLLLLGQSEDCLPVEKALAIARVLEKSIDLKTITESKTRIEQFLASLKNQENISSECQINSSYDEHSKLCQELLKGKTLDG